MKHPLVFDILHHQFLHFVSVISSFLTFACLVILHLNDNSQCGQNMIGFGLDFHWLRKWCKFCQPIIGPNIKSKTKANAKLLSTRN